MKLTNWTPFVMLAPTRYVRYSRWWSRFDLEGWSQEEYEWVEDGWNGLKDFATRPEETINTNTGDCEDYALVAASVLHSRDLPTYLTFCWNWSGTMHMVAHTPNYVYSSGNILEKDIEQYIEDSEYTHSITRHVV